MKVETTKCIRCGCDMLMADTVCPTCGRVQAGGRQSGARTMLAVALAAAVLIAFNWFKSPAPQARELAPQIRTVA
ncbi:putative paraquat-inducible protein A [Bradyrhizobium diazoefficiens]